MDFVVQASEAGARLDQFLAAHLAGSRAAVRRLIDAGNVRHNGHRARKGSVLRAGDRVSVTGPLPGIASLAPVAEPDLPLDILSVDDQVVALNKAAGMASHPLRPGERGTLAGALVARFPECATLGDDPRETGLVHRLDIDTSGVILAARSESSWRALRRSFREGQVHKRYLALVSGSVEKPQTIALPIAHAPGDRRKMVALDDAKRAERLGARAAMTTIRSLAQTPDCTLIEATAETGRMHQIRVHLAAIGHPLVGDTLYGGPPALTSAPGHFLHAAWIEFPHPLDGKCREVSAPLPDARQAALRHLKLL